MGNAERFPSGRSPRHFHRWLSLQTLLAFDPPMTSAADGGSSLDAPTQFVASVGQTEEDLHVQALVPQSAVEVLDITIFHRSSWPDEVQVHCILISPQIHRLAGELGPLSTVIDCGAPRSAITRSNTAATFSPLREASANDPCDASDWVLRQPIASDDTAIFPLQTWIVNPCFGGFLTASIHHESLDSLVYWHQ